MMDRIQEAMALHFRGDQVGARTRFTELWDELGDEGDPLHRCTLAHYMADAQEDPNDALVWDLRALEAAESLTDAHVKAHHPSLELVTFFPSLHLNIAENYRRLGRLDDARRHIAEAGRHVDRLADDGLGGMTRKAIARLANDLDMPL